jgi:hypothetical protein
MRTILTTIASLSVTASIALGDAPVVSTVSSPTMPDQTVLVSGEGFARDTEIRIARLEDGKPGIEIKEAPAPGEDARSVMPLQGSGRSLKFVVPKAFEKGMYVASFRTGDKDSEVVRINSPVALWVQSDQFSYSTPDGWLRIVGEALGFEGVESTVMLRKGSETHMLKAQELAYQQVAEKGLKGIEGEYCLHVSLPEELEKGDWEVWVHNGFGGAFGWQQAATARVGVPPKWPCDVFRVEGGDQRAIETAVAKAKENGGGTVYFPAGIYRPTKAIEVPPFTTLKGEDSGRVELYWPGRTMKVPPVALVYGKSDFAVEDLTLIQTGRHAAGIMCENGFAPDGGGNVTVRNVVIRLNAFSGVGSRSFQDPTAELIDRGLIGPSGIGGKEPYGRVAALMLGGDNITVDNVNVWSTGHPFILDRVGGIVKDSVFSSPVVGRYWIRACHRLIFENNQVECGGAVACYNVSYPDDYPFGGRQYTTTSNRNILLMGNRFFKSWKNDAEVLTVDSHPAVNLYIGPIAGAGEDTIQLPKENQYVFSGTSVGDQKCRKTIEPEKTYLVVGKIVSFHGGRWDQIYATRYTTGDDLSKEPEEWDVNVTARDDKRKLDYLATWAIPGLRFTDYRIGKTYASVTGADEKALLFHEEFNYSDEEFQSRKTPWFKGGSRFDPSDKGSFGSPAPNAIVDFDGEWNGVLKPSRKAITVTSGGWTPAWRKLPVEVDMNVSGTTYFSFFLKGDNGRGIISLGAADPARRPPDDQYHGFAEHAISFGVSSIPTYDRTIDENNAWHGAVVLVADGRGRGQYRFLRSASDYVLHVDRPWDVPPDQTSFVVVLRSFNNSIITANRIEDCGRLQMWGGSFGIIVDGNHFARSSGLAIMGMQYYGGLMPAWQCKLLNNTRIGFNAASISGSPSEPFFGGPLAGLGIVRGNHDHAPAVNGNLVDSLMEDNADTLRPFSKEDLEGRRKRAGFERVNRDAGKGPFLWLDNKRGLVFRGNRVVKDEEDPAKAGQ